MNTQKFCVVFDGPPGAVSGRFVEVEDAGSQSISFGHWTKSPEDGFWRLWFDESEELAALRAANAELAAALRRIEALLSPSYFHQGASVACLVAREVLAKHCSRQALASRKDNEPVIEPQL